VVEIPSPTTGSTGVFVYLNGIVKGGI